MAMLTHAMYLHVFILLLSKESEAGRLTSPEERMLVQRPELTTQIKWLPLGSGLPDPFDSL